MTMDQIVARCSKFSGYNLTWKVEDKGHGKVLIIEDPAHAGPSTLALSLTPGYLYEVYGRLRHWAITADEQKVMIAALQN
jgi:hypothetical protein